MSRPCPLFVSVLAVMVLGSPLVSGCVRAHAKAEPDMPPLDVPAPPPRAVEPLEADAEPPKPIEADAAPPKPEEPPAAAPARPRPTPARIEPQPTEPPKVAEEPPKPAAPATAAPTTTLQTTPAAEENAVERAIRATLARATSDLNRVDYRVLNVDARTQYDTAKRFIQQSDEAIRSKNLVFAKNLADKAATLAVQLAGK